MRTLSLILTVTIVSAAQGQALASCLNDGEAQARLNDYLMCLGKQAEALERTGDTPDNVATAVEKACWDDRGHYKYYLWDCVGMLADDIMAKMPYFDHEYIVQAVSTFREQRLSAQPTDQKPN
jgi:hypothetical protein